MNPKQKEQSRAMFAWSLSAKHDALDFERASDEELALLADAQLDATRRAQIIHQIAHDDSEYLRWMNIQHTLDGLRLPIKEEQSLNIVQRIKQLFSGWQAAGVGMALASVLAVGVFFYSPSSYPPNSDFDYDLHARTWQHSGDLTLQLPNEGLLRGPDAPKFARELVAEERVILAGVLEGLQLMGEGFRFENLSQALPLSQGEWLGESQHYEQWAMVGKLSALSYFKCASPNDASYFEKARPALEHLQKLLQKQDGALAAQLSQRSPSSVGDKDAVCRFSEKVMSRLAQIGTTP